MTLTVIACEEEPTRNEEVLTNLLTSIRKPNTWTLAFGFVQGASPGMFAAANRSELILPHPPYPPRFPSHLLEGVAGAGWRHP